MRKRSPFVVAGTLAVAAAMTFATAGAAADLSSNVSLVASIDYSDATHLEFMTRPDLPDANGDPRVFALGGARGATTGGLRVIEITDPDNPVLLAVVPCNAANAMDVAVVRVGAKWYAALGTNDNMSSCRGPLGTGRMVNMVDLTNPAAPVYLGWGNAPRPTKGAHTLVAHPTKPIVYVASQAGPERITTVEILDFAGFDPYASPLPAMPVYKQVPTTTPTGFSPHDITFSPDGTRAYVSSVLNSSIWDTTDALNPTTITVIVDPNIKIHHEAVLHPNGRHLLIVDEFFAVGATTGNPQCPGGGVTIFDLGPGRLWEAAPVHVGQFLAQDTSTIVPSDATVLDPACTAHEFQVAPDGSWSPWGWMGAGVRTFDLSALNAVGATPAPVPVTVTETGFYKEAPLADVWAAKAHPAFPGYIFVSDTANGFRVLKRSA